MANMAAFRVLRVSKCQRCLAHFESSAISVKRNKLLLTNILQPGVCVARHFAFKSFPWIQSSTDIYPQDPLLHRILGTILLNRRMRKFTGRQLYARDYQRAFKDCILLVSDLVSQMDPENELSGLLGSRLNRFLKESFAAVSEHKFNLHLEVSDVTNLHCIGIRKVSGPLEPSSECYVVNVLGQQIYFESSDIPEIEEAVRSLSFSKGKESAMNLVEKTFGRGERFQMLIKFRAKETFFITGPDGEILIGSKNSVSSYHMWLFESVFDWKRLYKKEHPLSWKVADMDKYVHWRSPKYKPLDIFSIIK